MQLQEALKKRRSIRTFEAKPIPEQVIRNIIDSARLAPTARNVQPWEFIVVTKKDALKKLAALAENGRFIAESSCCIAVFCQDTKYYLEDGSAATVNILLSAFDSGLASCWVAGDKKPYCEQVKKTLGVPKEFKLISLIPLGYQKEEVLMPEKRSLGEVLHWDEFGQKNP